MPPEYRRLIEAILADMPRLSGALCAGFPDVFDPPVAYSDDDKARVAFAKHCCRCCPALIECARWVDRLPRDRKPLGVTAGRLRPTFEKNGRRVSVRAPAAVV